MKSNLSSIKVVLMLLILSCFAASVTGQKPNKSETLVIKTKIYCDHCLDCNDCGGKLVHDLSFVKGIRKNILDPKAMTITITYNPAKITPEKIRQTISKLGYEADEIKADPVAYGKLDSCCKKNN